MENLPMVAEANHNLSQVQSRISTASFVLALHRARGAVKEELKRQRVRLADVEAREISARAWDYVIAHPELIADARPVVEGWFARGVFWVMTAPTSEGVRGMGTKIGAVLCVGDESSPGFTTGGTLRW
jgi:hypothetical protein